jgi:hypothetical protein
MKPTYGNKGMPEGKMIIRNNEVTKSRNRPVEVTNRYSVPATDVGMPENENVTKMHENLARITNSIQKINTKHDKHEGLNIARPQKELQKGAETQSNLQNKSITPRQRNTKEPMRHTQFP